MSGVSGGLETWKADGKLAGVLPAFPSRRADTQRETWAGDVLGWMFPSWSLAGEEQDYCWPIAPQQWGKAARLDWAEPICRRIQLLLLLLREKD